MSEGVRFTLILDAEAHEALRNLLAKAERAAEAAGPGLEVSRNALIAALIVDADRTLGAHK